MQLPKRYYDRDFCVYQNKFARACTFLTIINTYIIQSLVIVIINSEEQIPKH